MILLMMILKVNAFRLFYAGADRGTIGSSVFHENIHELNFDKLISEALAQQHYREGIRLLFLKSLKLLTDRQFIHWQAGKTNQQSLRANKVAGKLYLPRKRNPKHNHDTHDSQTSI